MTNTTRPASPVRFTQLDAMRFAFAMVVVVGHTLGFDRTLIHGAFAVDFFFVLSGFVLSHALIGRPMQPLGFAWARLARLYPLHLVAIVWLVCLVGIPNAPGFDLRSLLIALGLLQGLGLVGVEGWNFPSWSVGIEFLVNVLILYPIVRARSIFGAIAVIAVSFWSLIQAVGPVFDVLAITPVYGPLISAGLLRGLAGIPLGYLLYEAHLVLTARIDAVRHRPAATVFEIVAIALLGVSLWCSRPSFWNLLPVPLSALLVLQMATVPGHLSIFLEGRLFAGLGNISYAIYLLHIPLAATFARAGFQVRSASGPSAAWFVYMAVLPVLAALSFSYLERPAQRALTRLLPSPPRPDVIRESKSTP